MAAAGNKDEVHIIDSMVHINITCTQPKANDMSDLCFKATTILAIIG